MLHPITCTFSDLEKKQLQSFKKIHVKLKELRSQDTQCVYALVERTAKCHAPLQT